MKINKNTKIIAIVLLVIMIVVLAFTLKPTGFITLNNNLDKTYSFGGPKNIMMLPIVADTLDMYKENELNIKRKDIQTGKKSMDALISKSIDFGILVETNIAYIGVQMDNPEIEVIAIIEEKTDDAIIVNRNKGINTPEDLKGKTIGVPIGTGSYAYLLFYLKNINIDISEVNIINMTPPAIQAAMINQEIDAGCIWQPWRYNIENQMGDNVITFNNKEIYTDYAIIATRKDFAEKNPEVIIRFLQSLIDAEEYYLKNTSEIKEMLSDELNIPLNILESTWNEYELKISMDKKILTLVEEEGKLLLDKDNISYKDFFNINYLNTIDDKRVNWN